jgi:hypothetical protein
LVTQPILYNPIPVAKWPKTVVFSTGAQVINQDDPFAVRRSHVRVCHGMPQEKDVIAGLQSCKYG